MAKRKKTAGTGGGRTTTESTPGAQTTQSAPEQARSAATDDESKSAKPDAEADAKKPYTCLRAVAEAGVTYRKGQTVHLTSDRAAAIGPRFVRPAKGG